MEKKLVGVIENERIVCPTCNTRYKFPANKTLNFPARLQCRICPDVFWLYAPRADDEKNIFQQQAEPEGQQPANQRTAAASSTSYAPTQQCPGCGKQTLHEAIFCTNCGVNLALQSKVAAEKNQLVEPVAELQFDQGQSRDIGIDSAKNSINTGSSGKGLSSTASSTLCSNGSIILVNKPRKPWVAGLLAFITIGLGHIYSGKITNGVALCFGQVLLITILLFLLINIPNILFFIFAFILIISYYLFSIFDAIKIAKHKSHSYTINKFNKWYCYVGFFIIVNFVLNPFVQNKLKNNIIQFFNIPSGAMSPTLLIGDHILVNKFIYNSHNPQRGDLIVFEYPKDSSKDYLKRIVGTPGDVIEIKEKKLLVNKIEPVENYAIHHDPKDFPASVCPRDNFGPITVPDRSFFVMGDNRDNSFDSRFWGFVPEDKIHGKVMKIYWSWDKETNKIRWDRISTNV